MLSVIYLESDCLGLLDEALVLEVEAWTLLVAVVILEGLVSRS